jgi:hypothetical protein
MNNSEKRIAAMSAGVPELERFLYEAAAIGLASLQSWDDAAWESVAARLSDAKLSGLAKRVRVMKSSRTSNAWDRIFRRELAALYLWLQGFRRIAELPGAMGYELLLQGGWSPRKEEVLQEGSYLSDDWFVLALHSGIENQLYFCQTWFFGEKTGKIALQLEYAWGAPSFASPWRAGDAFQGDMVFFPSAYPLRAVPLNETPLDRPFAPRQGVLARIQDLGDAFAHAVAAQPWLEAIPCLLDQVRIVQQPPHHWLVVDKHHQAIPAEWSPSEPMPRTTSGTWLLFATWTGKKLLVLKALKQR